MKRIIVLAGVLALSMAGIASAASGGAKIGLRKTNRGKLVVNSKGRTLYMFAKDKRNKDVCVKIKFCTTTWPPVTTKGRPVAGTGIQKSMLGTIKLPNGKQQVTYGGHPLYTYRATSRATRPTTSVSRSSAGTGTRSTPRARPSSSDLTNEKAPGRL